MAGKRIAVIGDNCVDRYIRPKEAQYPGGNAVNMAMHLSRLGHRVRYAGCVGDDSDGAWLLRVLNRVGVDASLVETLEGRSGVTVIELVEGERRFLEEIVGVQSPLQLPAATMDDIAYESNLVVVTGFTAYQGGPRQHQPDLPKELWFFEQADVPVAMDFSLMHDPDLWQELGPLLDLAFVSAPDPDDAEAEALVRAFQHHGPRIVVLTRGARGSMLATRDDLIKYAAKSIQPVDTLGAGDAFLAGFAAAHADRAPLEECLRRATDTATEVCMHFGSYPLTDEDLA